MKLHVACIVGAFLASRLTGVATAQGCTDAPCIPGPTGCWSASFDWIPQIFECTEPPTVHCEFLEISHAALIPYGAHQGEVLFWNNDCSGKTTYTWVFDPQQPACIAKVSAYLDTSIFCSGMTWDANGRLIVGGGNSQSPDNTSTFRFRPALLEKAVPSPSCVPTLIPGRPWVKLGELSWSRYYPTLITLLGGEIPSSAPLPYAGIQGAATFVIGGSDFGFCTGVDGPCGTEFFQFMDPGANHWSRTLAPAVANPAHVPPGLEADIEYYTPLPRSNPPDVLFDSYPRAFQLAKPAGGALDTDRNILIAGDINTQYPAINASNAEGSTWILKPTYHGSVTTWELHRVTSADGEPPVPGIHNDRHYGSAVLMHTRTPHLPESDGRNRVLVFGGAEDTSVDDSDPETVDWRITPSVQEFRPGDDPVHGVWIEKETPLQSPRLFGNAVCLPTGDVLIVGGASHIDSGAEDFSTGLRPLLPLETRPELYSPGDAGVATGASSIMMAEPEIAPGTGVTHPYVRLYHNLALLLPDGRVMTLGGERFDPDSCDFDPPPSPCNTYGDGRWSGEMFSPPYLGYGFRPSILEAPVRARFGAKFNVVVEHDVHLVGDRIDRIVLLRPAAVTHAFDADQRYIELDFAPLAYPNLASDRRVYKVTAPAADLGPPGYYMLFVIERRETLQGAIQRAPSVAHFIRLF